MSVGNGPYGRMKAFQPWNTRDFVVPPGRKVEVDCSVSTMLPVSIGRGTVRYLVFAQEQGNAEE